ncbi:MAG: hypothetical protein ACOY4D_09255 [Pseudomonadota bacterium]
MDIKHLFLSTTAALFALVLTACGGGGGDGGTPPGISYTGLITPAAITQSNATRLAGGAYQGRTTGNALGGVTASAQANEMNSLATRPDTLVLSETLRNAVAKIDVTALPKADLGAAVKTETISEQGSCGGNLSGNATYDESTGNITSGAITFNNYCEEGVTLSGRITFSGKMNLGTQPPTIAKLDISFISLSGKSGTDAFTVSGSIAIDVTVPLQVRTTINMVSRDDTTGKVFKMENYQLLGSVNPDAWVDISMTGRFYDPDDGYVDLTTPMPFRFTINATSVVAETPMQGELVITGDKDTKARLVAMNTADYNIDVDADGNGIYESQTRGKWADL